METEKKEECQTTAKITRAHNSDFEQEVEYHQLRLNIAKKEGDRVEESHVYSNLGKAYYSVGDFKKALEYHQLHLTISKEVGERDGEARAYANLGIAYISLGDFQKAISYHQLHLNVCKELSDRAGEGRACANLGIAYNSLGDFKKAIEFHQIHLEIAKEVGNRASEGRAYANLGNDYNSLGEFQTAIEYHCLDLSIAKDIGDKVGQGRAYGNLGNAYYSIGDFKKAIEYHQLDLEIATEVGDRVGKGKTYSNLGVVYKCLGDFRKAIEYHQLYLSLSKDVGDRHGQGHAYANLGIAYDCLGDFKKAIEFHQLHLKIAKEAADRAGEGAAYTNLGIAYTSLGDFQKAIEYHQQSLCLAQEFGDRATEGRAYANLGVCYYSLGDFKKAIEYHQLDLSIAKDVGDTAGEGRAYSNLGIACTSISDLKTAIEYHRLDLQISKQVGDKAGEGRAYANLGNAYCSLGDLIKAEEFYRYSIKMFDSIREHLHSNDEWKISLRNHYKDPYTALWNVLLQQNKTDEALFTAELGRGQALMDLMESHYSLKSSELKLSQQSDIYDILNYISTETVFLAIGKNAVNFWVLRKGKEPCFVSQKINKRYVKENAIATFVSLNEDVYSKIGVRETIKCENSPMDEPSIQNCDDQRSNVKGSMSAYGKDHPLKVLYDLVIGPISDLISANEITIVPDGPLFLAPFAAFVDQRARYLSETHTIRLVPTLSSLKMMAACPEQYHSITGALLVGDPCVASIRVKGKTLKQLQNANKEVEMIGKVLTTEPLTGKNATKAEVLCRLGSVALVHIAAHGKEETGEIYLSPNPTTYKRPKEKGYLLTMEDVKNAELNARLVVLSCCHSSQGEVKAEGVVGIARAFLGAGARSVLASLWKIDDQATLKFMEQFYQHLVKGESASKSLNQAMKWMRESEDFNEVRLWAPFVLIGDDVTLDLVLKAGKGLTSHIRTPELQQPEEEHVAS